MLEGTIALPNVVNVAGKQVNIDQLTDVEVAPKQNQLHLGRVRLENKKNKRIIY